MKLNFKLKLEYLVKHGAIHNVQRRTFQHTTSGRGTKGHQTTEDKAGNSNEAGPSGMKATVRGKKQSYPGLAENTKDDGTGVVPSRKCGQPRKKDVDAGGTEDANVKQPPKKKRT
ncbi:hypothetical protein BT96DRAFT_939218 [Gymnopus androsaceus JB14]|uniref:Uncharacterized protein n=1 Tax=Gymnopus androsaceus JB14 TaxID=1447944 RepID=A0A6A4HQN7_9AGAR|nr:hypothetical protein BT96DRAFT_939218 [Gymnopus androsaceus JB14]